MYKSGKYQPSPLFISRIMLFLLIMGSSEFVVMLTLDSLQLSRITSEASLALLDALLLALISFYPLYRFVFKPLLLDRNSLKQNEQLILTALDSTREGLIITDSDARILHVNNAFSTISGYSREDVLGHTPNILSSGRQGKQFYASMWNSLLKQGHWKGKLWNKRKNGEIYHEGLQITRVEGSFDQDYYVGVFYDLAEQDELEANLAEAQKMEALATLVGGVAHNFNNFLAGVMGRSYLGKKCTSLDKTRTLFAGIEEDGHKAAALVKDLMVFSRDICINEQPCDAADILHAAVKTSRLAIPETIDLQLDIQNTKLPIFANPSQIEQIILNMINNARDALEDTDEPCIRLQLLKTSYSYCPDKWACPKKHDCKSCQSEKAVFIISDNGHGIPEDKIGQIFDPFYTTKEIGMGTGLGLSTAFQTVQRHHGSMFVESTPGHGATFTICLPLDHSEHVRTDTSVSPITIPGTGETILLVDDEPSILEVSRQVLEELNYRVITAQNGKQAVELFAQQPQDIALIVTDMVMPKMNGDKAVQRMRNIKPEQAVIFTSGYSDVDILENYQTRFIRKPFDPATLSQQIHHLLQASAQTSV